MRHATRLIGSFALLLSLALPAGAETPGEVLKQLLSDTPATADEFSPDFLAQVPLTQLQPVLDATRAQLGPVTGIEMDGDSALVETDTATMKARIALDAEGRVTMLFFELPSPKTASFDQARSQLLALGDKVAWLVRRDGAVIEAESADEPLAVASAFKLGVLAVLRDDIAAGRHNWADVVTLEARHKSLPTGEMQNFPDGSPVTLHTTALEMIYQSDNTATDLLIDTLGRARVAERLGLARLLTTRELFALKADAGARVAWLAGDDSAAGRAAETLPEAGAASGSYVPGLEWNIPLTRLCDLIEPMADEPVLQVNPGPVAGDWQSVAYKGGSETGVLNFTTALIDAKRHRYCVALTVNGGAADLTAGVAAFRTLLAASRSAP